MVKDLPAKWETWVQSLGWEDALEEGVATHSSILGWRVPRTEEPGGPRSLGSRERLSGDTQDMALAPGAVQSDLLLPVLAAAPMPGPCFTLPFLPPSRLWESQACLLHHASVSGL